MNLAPYTDDKRFVAFAPLVSNLVHKYSRTQTEREDMLGELYLKFLEIDSQYDAIKGSSYPAYIVSRLRWFALDIGRSRGKLHTRFVSLNSILPDSLLLDSHQESILDRLETEACAMSISRYMSTLPPKRQVLVMLRYELELDWNAIYAMFPGENKVTLRSNARHGITRLRNLLNVTHGSGP